MSQNAVAQYCAAGAGNIYYLYITNMQLNGIDNSSSVTAGGYADYTYLSTDLLSGEDYDFSVSLNYNSGNDISVWIDFNDNGDFYDVGEEVLHVTDQPSSGTYTLAIPLGANLGSHTMRVRNSYNDIDDPCGNSSYGEVEDYTVNIIHGLIVTAIDQDEFSSCGSANESIDLTFVNSNTGNSYTNFNINLSLEKPDGTTTEWVDQYVGTIADNATGVHTLTGVDLSQIGEYVLTAEADITGVDTYAKSKTFSIQTPYAIPYIESFDGNEDEYWDLGDNFSWDSGNMSLSGNVSSTHDTIVSPSISISEAQYYFTYDADYSSLSSSDTVFVQIAEACTGNFVTVDSIINDATDPHRGIFNTYYDDWTLGKDLSSYNGKDIQIRFVVSTHAWWSDFYLNDVKVMPGNNVAVNEIILDDYSFHSDNSYQLSVAVQNMGAITQSNIPIDMNVYGGVVSTLNGVLPGPIQYGDIDTVLIGSIDATQFGDYELIAHATVTGDVLTDDNTLSSVMTIDKTVQNFPIILDDDFANFDADGDGTDDPLHWLYSNFHNNGNYLFCDYIDREEKATIRSFKFGPIPENAYFAFDYQIQSYDDAVNWGNDLGTTDLINIEVSSDNGATYTGLTFIDHSTYTATAGFLTLESQDLSSYVGENLIFRVTVENGAGLTDGTSLLRFTIDNLHIGSADIAATDLDWDFDTWCGEKDANIDVEVKNTSNVKALNIPVTVEVTSASVQDSAITVIIPELDANTTDTVSIGTFDFSISGDYEINAYVSFPDDYDNTNDTQNSSLSIQDIEEIPVLEDFNPIVINWNYNTDLVGWIYSDENNDDLGIGNNGYIYTDWLGDGDSAQVYTFKFGKVEAGEYLAFDYIVNTYSDGYSLIGNYLRDGDVVNLYLSTDCGTTWGSPVYTIDNTNHTDTDEWQYIPNFDLTAYAGQNVRAMIEFVKGNETGYNELAINTFQVVATGDAGVVEVDVPQYVNNVAVCGTESDQAMVVVQNFGLGTISNIPVGLDVVFATDTLTYTGTTGSIAPGMTDTVYISGFNSVESGDYELIGYTMLDKDTDTDNDIVPVSGALTVQDLHTVPWDYFGTSMPSDWQFYNTIDPENNLWSSSTTIEGNPNYLATPMLNENDTAFVTLQKVGPIASGYNLHLTYNVFSYDNDNGFIDNYLREGDKFEVQIATDCGATYTSVATFTSDDEMGEDDTTFVYDLSSYAGENVSLRLMVVKGSDIGQLRVGIDTVRFTIPQSDVAFTKVFVEDEICGKANQAVYAIVTNNSEFETATGFDINAVIKEDNSNGFILDDISYTYSMTLGVSETDTVQIGTFDSQMENKYFVDAVIDYNLDEADGNDDANTTFTIWPVEEYDYSTDFLNNDNGWKYYDYSDDNANSFYDWWNGFIRTEVLKPNDDAVFYSPKIGPLATDNELQYDYQIISGSFGIGDAVDVYISNDCGSTWTLLNSLQNSANTTPFNEGTVNASLEDYNGDEVIFKFVVTNLNGDDFEAVIDNFEIVYKDLEIVGILNQSSVQGDDFVFTAESHNVSNNYDEESGYWNYAERYITCGEDTDSIFVVFENTGKVDITSIPFSFDINGTEVVNTTFDDYTIEPGDRAAFYVTSVNSSTSGLQDMKAFINVENDSEESNDTIGFSVTTQETYELPFEAFHTDNFNEEEYWKYDVNGNMEQWNGDGLRAYMLDNVEDQNEGFATTPKVMLGNSSYLYFDYAVYNSDEPHIISDENVQVFISTDCSDDFELLWEYDVTYTDNADNGAIAIDLSDYAGQSVRIKFRAYKGNSNGEFSAYFTDINIYDYAPMSILVEDSNGEPVSNNDEICEGEWINLFNLNSDVSNFNYVWTFENADSTYTRNGSNWGHTMQDFETGDFTLSALDDNGVEVYSQVISLTTIKLPEFATMPTGNYEIVSNLPTETYTVDSIENAEAYIWSLDDGGAISGRTNTAIAHWTNGFVGVVGITVQGQNQCGLGDESDPLYVWVEYLGDAPESGDNGKAAVGDNSFSVYPNPSNGIFNINIDEEWETATVQITNSFGSVVYKNGIVTDNTEVNIQNQPPGAYNILIKVNGNTYTTVIIIN